MTKWDAAIKFKAFFGVDMADFWDMFGFDVIKFDKWIMPKSGQSTYQKTEEKYGRPAADFTMSLCNGTY